MAEKQTAGVIAYGRAHKALHWLVVALLAVQFAVAWSMPDIHRDTKPEGLISLHLSVGAMILVVVILRFFWRFGHPVPLIRDQAPLWRQRGAQATHALLYLLLLLVPVMGWANASYHGWTIDLFGLVRLPRILPTGAPLGHQLGDVHTVASYVLLGLVGLHVAAVLYHQFWLRDRIMSRMLGGR